MDAKSPAPAASPLAVGAATVTSTICVKNEHKGLLLDLLLGCFTFGFSILLCTQQKIKTQIYHDGNVALKVTVLNSMKEPTDMFVIPPGKTYMATAPLKIVSAKAVGEQLGGNYKFEFEDGRAFIVKDKSGAKATIS